MLIPPPECVDQGDFVGIFDISRIRQSLREPRDLHRIILQILSDVHGSGFSLDIGVDGKDELLK